jgi:phosphoglycolate phosphatase
MRRLPKTHVVLFDIDGTLVSSQQSELDERRRYIDAIRDVTGKVPSVNPSRFAGMVDPQICRTILTETGIDERSIETCLPKVLSRMSQAYQKMPKKIALNLGVHELLGILSSQWQSHILGVLTGNLSPIGKEKLAAAGIERYFQEGFYADHFDDRLALVDYAVNTCVSKYQLPERKNVLIIGDTPLDVKAANAAHATSIGIASGVYSIENLAKEGAHAVFHDLTPSKRMMAFLAE